MPDLLLKAWQIAHLLLSVLAKLAESTIETVKDQRIVVGRVKALEMSSFLCMEPVL